MKSFSIKQNDIKMNIRLSPPYYYYTKIIKQSNKKKGIQYIIFEKIIDKISDGEHSHIPRINTPGIRYLYGRNIKEGIINFDPISDVSYIKEDDYNKFKRCHISENDILISIYGTIGKSAIYKEKYVGKAGIPRHIANISIMDNSVLTKEFITAFFRSRLGKWQLHSITTGNMQQLLSLKHIRQLELPVPDIKLIERITKKEKKAINYEISALENIENARKLLYDKICLDFSKVKRPKIFSVSNNELFDAGFWTSNLFNPLYVNTQNEIQKIVKTESLGDLVSVKKGDEVGSINYSKYLDKKSTDIPFIRTSDIINFEIDQFPDYFVNPEIYKSLKQDLKAGDILFTKDGKIGLTCLMLENDKAIIASGITRIRLNSKAKELHLTPEYLFLLLSLTEIGTYQARRRTVTASTIPHLTEERLKQIEIPIFDDKTILEITRILKEAFMSKNKKKQVIREIMDELDSYFNI